jgi:hypothetical protein
MTFNFSSAAFWRRGIRPNRLFSRGSYVHTRSVMHVIKDEDGRRFRPAIHDPFLNLKLLQLNPCEDLAI